MMASESARAGSRRTRAKRRNDVRRTEVVVDIEQGCGVYLGERVGKGVAKVEYSAMTHPAAKADACLKGAARLRRIDWRKLDPRLVQECIEVGDRLRPIAAPASGQYRAGFDVVGNRHQPVRIGCQPGQQRRGRGPYYPSSRPITRAV
jgi:hypothetical protein